MYLLNKQTKLDLVLVLFGNLAYNVELRFIAALVCGNLTQTGSKTSRYGADKVGV